MTRLSSWRIAHGHSLALSSFDPSAKPFSQGDKATDKARIAELSEQIGAVQERLYATRQRSLLIVLQGMDTSGKDGTVRSVFSGINPQGVRVVSFKAPTQEEREHDFLWRVHRHVPAAGEIAIFNRSHYEDVLITRVKGWIDDAEAERRLAHIRHFEQLLADRGTAILKCFLHISKDEQKARLEERLADPAKHWKFDPADLVERKAWDDYQCVYAEALSATSEAHAPWYVVPANSKTHRNLMVAELVLEALQGMKLEPPQANPALAGMKVA
ncbi:polyphosphate kinase 2 family protein [Viridibacterium curvum]|uniref:Polyphosphate kinase-2-related domain-containing protein n=1 Tax=Viridibacterium curvum TaxID=1101404 RepID=A0ABP9Q652_9RHOO